MYDQRALLLAIVCSLALTGCSTLSDGPATPKSAVTSGQETPTIDAQVNVSEARERALNSETDYVTARLQNASCLDSWDVGSFTVGPKVTVVNHSDRGITVRVRRPYSTAKGEAVYDAEHYARYLVTKTGTERLSGDTVAPC